MAKFISVFIERSHQRLVGFVLWCFTFLFVLALACGFAAHQVRENMTGEARVSLEPMVRLRESVVATFAEMSRQLTADPCSPQFHDQLRAIAFLPDGLNEFLYAPGGVAQCSVSLNFPPHRLGTADLVIAGSTSELQFWFDRDLSFMGLLGHEGSIALREPLAIVIPPQPVAPSPRWMKQELVAISQEGVWWHRNGDEGVYERLPRGPLADWLPIHNGAFYTRACDSVGIHCIVAEAPLAGVLASNSLTIAAAIVICALLAMAISGQVHAMLRRYWSFEARFRRNFDAESIICTYQPILSLSTGTISGCEVLVRWRDVNGATIFPDQFLPIVEKHGLGRQMTKFIIDKAYVELSKQVPHHLKLQINFNIFPADLDAGWLRDTLVIFENSGNRFNLVVEIVESAELDVERAQREIEALRRYGIKTHLDDFGTGYSNIQNLATLAVDGVKLDRSFAMASEGSLMARMLGSAIEMVHAAGHRVTVEGVETEERLAMIKTSGQVDFVQGYLIARPLDIGRFVQFLGEQGMVAPLRPRLVA
jgi:sensor c-di-GMP phosphodiesterase-like protein